MLLLLVILYLFFLKERLVEYSAAQNYANGKGNLERKIPKGSEFTVGEKFRVRVVLSKDLENNANFDLFKNFARNHFRCNELDAVDLESDGHGGSRLSHFERRLSIGEVMSPKVDIMASVSGLTLSFFKDTGWYDVNMSMAEPWDWGRNQGCEFIFESCGRFIKRQKTASPWCNEPITKNSGIRCIPHINAYGVCNLVDVGHTLKPEHTHFNNLPDVEPSRQNRFGGFDIHADYCPYMHMFNNVMSTTMNSHCGDINNRKYQDVHSDSQYYGKKSRCFNYGTTYMSGNRSWSFSGCFQVREISGRIRKKKNKEN
ncbi:unnamed protein product [Schistosoma rodhaini]|uniref:Leishmanolysin-like peptidase n=1 Tax=Schistosoma rodhaini TaxID=6188 RepID=A0AA85GLJ5_9TREM|nr:unnamed protein product [Schistosoma rodhaini]